MWFNSADDDSAPCSGEVDCNPDFFRRSYLKWIGSVFASFIKLDDVDGLRSGLFFAMEESHIDWMPETELDFPTF